MGSPKKIAVLAVHGISDPPPGSSVRAVSNLLLNLEENRKPVYSFLQESTIRIQSRPIRIEKPDSKTGEPPVTEELCEWVKNGRLEDAHLAFLRGQVECYKGEDPDEPYETLKLEGSRKAGSCNPEVHLYEMHWADLSHFGGKGLRILGEIYQILLHLPSVGVHTLRAASLDEEELKIPDEDELESKEGKSNKKPWLAMTGVHAFAVWLRQIPARMLDSLLFKILDEEERKLKEVKSNKKSWLAMTKLHAFAAWLLQVPAAMLNLLLLALALSAGSAGLLAKMSAFGHASILTLSALAFVAVVVCMKSYGKQKPPLVWVALSFSIFGVGAVWLFSLKEHWIPMEVLSYLSLAAMTILSLVAVNSLAKSYSKMRRITTVWRVENAVALVVLIILSCLWKSPAVVDSTPWFSWLILLRTIEIVYYGLTLVWGVLYAMIWIVELAGWRFLRNRHDRLARARRTARLTLALPAFFYILLSIVLWTGIVAALSPLIPTVAGDQYVADSPLQYRPVFKAEPIPASALGGKLVVESAVLPGTQVPFAILALLILVCGLTPMVLAEVSPPENEGRNRSASEAMGRWLSHSNRSSIWSARLMYGLFMASFPIAIVLLTTTWFNGPLEKVIGPLIVGLGEAVAGGAIGVFALSRTFRALAGLLAPLDALLDVDNYMHEHPRETNPTARIFGRYLSILRCVKDGGYDGIVIVSHSQGTVITADLLRFCQRFPNLLGTTLPPTFLFTMGCPLRNLYGTFFPHLYKWAFEQPLPATLGIKEWVNAYRSGDYVGRYLWRDQDKDDIFLSRYRSDGESHLWDLTTEFDPKDHPVGTGFPATREICIGAGAHTHYWDETAPEIAFELDRLIQLAACDPKVAAEMPIPTKPIAIPI